MTKLMALKIADSPSRHSFLVSFQEVCNRYDQLADVRLADTFKRTLLQASIMHNTVLLNSIPVMAPILAPILGIHFFRGHISLKNRTYCPLFSHDSSSFKGTCFLIRLIVLPDALYGPHLHWCLHRLFHNCPKHVFCQLGIDSNPCKS
jgi:hypothetical protein